MTTTPISRIHGEVEIPPLANTDRTGLALESSHLTAETRWRRFGGAAGRLSEHDLDQLTKVDDHDHEALAAIEPDTGQIVGVARYVALPNDPGAAEVAIEVDDEWQGRGIGGRLMSELLERARAERIARLVAYVSADNRPVLGWIGRSGGIVQADSGDARLYSIPTDRFARRQRAA